MRTFIAIPLPSNIKTKLNNIQNELKKINLVVKWVEKNNLHITVKFIGELEETLVKKIEEFIIDTAKNFPILELELNGFGFFPNEKKPRVFFVSTNKESELRRISEDIEEKLETLGIPKEGRFRSHITLARFKQPSNIHILINKLKTLSLDDKFLADKIAFYKSTLTPKGPLYEEIFSYPLSSR